MWTFIASFRLEFASSFCWIIIPLKIINLFQMTGTRLNVTEAGLYSCCRTQGGSCITPMSRSFIGDVLLKSFVVRCAPFVPVKLKIGPWIDVPSLTRGRNGHAILVTTLIIFFNLISYRNENLYIFIYI